MLPAPRSWRDCRSRPAAGRSCEHGEGTSLSELLTLAAAQGGAAARYLRCFVEELVMYVSSNRPCLHDFSRTDFDRNERTAPPRLES